MVVWEALDALSHQLELCAIDADSRIVIISGPETEPDTIDLVRAAVSRTGADALDIRPVRIDPRETAKLFGGPLVESLLDVADIAIDCRVDSTIDRHPALDAGLRVLRLLPAAATPHRYPPHASMRRRVERLATQLESVQTVNLTDSVGTRLKVTGDWSAVTFDHGFVSAAGTIGSYPSGWVRIEPGPGAVEGDLVIMPGDGNVTGGYVVNSPVRLCIRKDMITAIEGDSPDADVVRSLLERAADPNAYGFGSLTIGMNPGTRSAGAPFDPIVIDAKLSNLTAGLVSVTFGNNDAASRPCDDNLTVALSQRSVSIDELPIVTAGVLQGDFAPDVYESPA